MFPFQFPGGVGYDEARENCLEEPGIEPDLASITSIQEQGKITSCPNFLSFFLFHLYQYLLQVTTHFVGFRVFGLLQQTIYLDTTLEPLEQFNI